MLEEEIQAYHNRFQSWIADLSQLIKEHLDLSRQIKYGLRISLMFS